MFFILYYSNLDIFLKKKSYILQGSYGLPLVGHLFQFRQDSAKLFMSNEKRYGGVYKLMFGGQPVVSSSLFLYQDTEQSDYYYL